MPAQETPGLVGESVDVVGAGGVDVAFEVGVEQLSSGLGSGALTGHRVQFDPVGVGLQPGADGLAAVDRVPVGDDVDLYVTDLFDATVMAWVACFVEILTIGIADRSASRGAPARRVVQASTAAPRGGGGAVSSMCALHEVVGVRGMREDSRSRSTSGIRSRRHSA
ncbi:hypothetical protein [Saccharothrix luteola]|uniref:hypothetical protein n=1 Tax=Saccharothrix luteola TaxID=2893018 RepID=UPI001E347617|nr:hypothetical protein [Saccharothrix luteola]MCC8243061.1 hypothetical protein [Saccharothrix luteola]